MKQSEKTLSAHITGPNFPARIPITGLTLQKRIWERLLHTSDLTNNAEKS